MGVLIQGEQVGLMPNTNELWHEFHRNYIVDPMMDTNPYAYDFEQIEKAYYLREQDKSRCYFIIVHDEKVIGRIYLKHMNKQEKSTEFGVALINDSVKGKGFGTEAIKLLINYAFHTLCFETILADSVLRNTRSQHVLEKIGFKYTHEDSIFKYYRLCKCIA